MTKKNIAKTKTILDGIDLFLEDHKIYFGESKLFKYSNKPIVKFKLEQRKKLKRKLRKMYKRVSS